MKEEKIYIEENGEKKEIGKVVVLSGDIKVSVKKIEPEK